MFTARNAMLFAVQTPATGKSTPPELRVGKITARAKQRCGTGRRQVPLASRPSSSSAVRYRANQNACARSPSVCGSAMRRVETDRQSDADKNEEAAPAMMRRHGNAVRGKQPCAPARRTTSRERIRTVTERTIQRAANAEPNGALIARDRGTAARRVNRTNRAGKPCSGMFLAAGRGGAKRKEPHAAFRSIAAAVPTQRRTAIACGEQPPQRAPCAAGAAWWWQRNRANAQQGIAMVMAR